VRGEVTVEIRTDNPDSRFAIGATLVTDPKNKGPLTIRDARNHSGTLLLSFNGFDDRTSVESLRNVLLLSDVNPKEANETEDDFHISQIIGCEVRDTSEKNWGVVTDVLNLPAQDTLVIEFEGREILVPFVRAFVPTVDVKKKVVLVQGMEGLL